MAITVKYFASLRERIGREQDTLDMPPEKLTVADLWQQVNHDQPLPDDVLAAINLEYVKPDAEVRDGDEVAFFPPVTGG